MINANELRIGNYLEDHHTGSLMTVVEIKTTHTRCSYIRIDNNEPHVSIIDNDWLHPIPLTEGTLKKCGFVQHPSPFSGVFTNGSISLVGDYDDSYRVVGYKLVFHINAGTTEAKVICLHQLQNLYFALTGKELVYTP